jgi:hypothetical protein
MDIESLRYLLSGGHYNVPDRIARGIWPHPPLKYDELVEFLAVILKNERWFPREWKPYIKGEAINEFGTIEHQSQNRFVYRKRRSNAINPYVLAEETEKVFNSAEDAAKFYLKWDLHLPGDLDSWKVVEG